MKVIGLTGNIASGKSVVADILAERGATIVDADVLSREAVTPGSPALDAIAARWGPSVLSADGSLDRSALRKVVFHDRNELDALNEIVHPEVRRLRDAEVAAARAHIGPEDRGALIACARDAVVDIDVEPVAEPDSGTDGTV